MATKSKSVDFSHVREGVSAIVVMVLAVSLAFVSVQQDATVVPVIVGMQAGPLGGQVDEGQEEEPHFPEHGSTERLEKSKEDLKQNCARLRAETSDCTSLCGCQSAVVNLEMKAADAGIELNRKSAEYWNKLESVRKKRNTLAAGEGASAEVMQMDAEIRFIRQSWSKVYKQLAEKMQQLNNLKQKQYNGCVEGCKAKARSGPSQLFFFFF